MSDAAKLPPMKPCPFCGSHGELVIVTEIYAYVKCAEVFCEAEGPNAVGPEAAVARWNERYPATEETS